MSPIHRGTNASGMRRYNERLILSAIRRSGGTSKADLSRITGLSPQAVVRIVDELEADGMLVQTGRRTGGMGQPAKIYGIDSRMGWTIGVEIARNGVTLAMLDFDGVRRAGRRVPMRFPAIDAVIAEVRAFAQSDIRREASDADAALLGVGIAMPWFLGEWRDEAGFSPEQVTEWRDANVEQRFRDGIDSAVFFENDGNAAALAHLLCGVARDLRDFLCINIGTFVGGGLVLGGQLVPGRHGNAAALASMPVVVDGGRGYLLQFASTYALPGEEDQAARTGWVARCADALAFAAIGANSLLDLEAIVLDGALPWPLLDDVVQRLRDRLAQDVPPDFFTPALRTGTLGEEAGAIGAGLLPIYSSYSPDLAALSKPAEKVA